MVLQEAPQLKSLPVVTDDENKILLGSVSKRHLTQLLRKHVLIEQQDSRSVNRINPAEIIGIIRNASMRLVDIFLEI